MTNNTVSTETIAAHGRGKSYWTQRSWRDWLTALALIVGAAFAWQQFHPFMDGYEKAILIGAVPTLIAGIYGMNFDNMPELHSQYGYFYVLGVIVLIVAALWWFFRKRNWL